MSSCIALKKDGTACTSKSKGFEGMCGTHHNAKLKTDGPYRARWVARQIAATPAPVPLAAPAAPAANAAKREKNARILAGIARPSFYKIILYATKLVVLWKRESITGMDCAKAYIILKYMPITHPTEVFPHILVLLRAVVSVYLLTNHPEVERYSDVPAADKAEALEALRVALVPFEQQNIFSYMPAEDGYASDINRRILEEDTERRRRLREAQERQERQERQEQLEREVRRRNFQIALRERPVVFKRDPEGSIDIRAFATDHQNVHRSSVQNATQKACLTLMKRPVCVGQETLPEILLDLQDPRKVRLSTTLRDRIVTELTHDYFETQAFSLQYGDILDRVWAYIRIHEQRSELYIRLIQEIADGLEQCSNGKTARLVNTLQGFDETLEMDPPKEMFQNSISMLTQIPAAEREPRARALFLEYAIPEADQAAWLEPLMDS